MLSHMPLDPLYKLDTPRCLSLSKQSSVVSALRCDSHEIQNYSHLEINQTRDYYRQNGLYPSIMD